MVVVMRRMIAVCAVLHPLLFLPIPGLPVLGFHSDGSTARQ